MVRRGDKSEVENFQLWHEDNAGDEIIVVERDEQIVGFAQFDEGYSDATIHFIEADDSSKGIGSEMISWFQENYTELTTTNTNPHCQEWLKRRGFEQEGKKDWQGHTTMKWWHND